MFKLKKSAAEYHRSSSDEEEPMFADGRNGVCVERETTAEENEQLFRKDTCDDESFSSRASSRNSQKQTGWKDAWRKVGVKVSSYVASAMSPNWSYASSTATREAVATRISDASQEPIKAL